MTESSDNIFKLFKQLWKHFSDQRKFQLSLLLFLMILTAFAEIFSLGAVIPFLAVLIDPASVFENPTMQPVLLLLNINSPDELLLPLTLAFAAAALIAGAMRLLQAWANVRVSFAVGSDLGISVYRRTLYQPYSVHVSRNSSSIINAVITKVLHVVANGLSAAITMITSVFILLSIMGTLLLINPVVAMSAFAGFGFTYAVIILITRKRLKDNGNLIAKESNLLVKSLQEGLGGIRDILLDGSQEVYSDIYGKTVIPLYRAQGSNRFIGQSPRFLIESIGMVLIATLAYFLVGQPGGISKAIPLLGALAFGAQRMLPILQQFYFSWSTIQGVIASMQDVLELLEQPMPEQQELTKDPLQFKKTIELRNLDFQYNPDAGRVIRDANLMIPKGSKVGFIGETGSGKSTMLDIIMALLQPTKGQLIVDGNVIDDQTGKAWQYNIAHVPQSIFLSDNSVEENIAFGVPTEKIDHERVKWAASHAQINRVIETLPNQYNTLVGENGVRLSGGQRQRIGIARALYKNTDVIIFDEATSALDNQTEADVMQAIEELHEQLTVLIIAHRLTTLKNCDMIVELDKGKIKRKGTFKEILGSISI